MDVVKDMLIRVRCRQCGKLFQFRAADAGRRATCPSTMCRQPLRLPTTELIAALPAADGHGAESSARRMPRSIRPGHIVVAGTLILALLAVAFAPGNTDQLHAESSTTLAARDVPANAADTPKGEDRDAEYANVVEPFFKTYCWDCHSPDYAEGEVDFGVLLPRDDFQKHREQWEKAYDMLRISAMPPSEADQPEKNLRQRVVAWLEHELYYIDCDADPDPGRVTIRRLNRTEYNNTVRDLLGVHVEPADDFPSDDVGYGFDNIGDVLSLPPLLMEKYLDAAETIANRVVVTEHPQFQSTILRGRELESSGSANFNRFAGRWVQASAGEVYGEFRCPTDGDYEIRVHAAADQAGDEPARMALTLNGEVAEHFNIKGNEKESPYTLELHLKKGKHRIGARFVNDFYVKHLSSKQRKQNRFPGNDRNLHVASIQLEGPLDVDRRDLPRSHRRLIGETPRKGVSVEDAAHANLTPLLFRAFRRPVSDAEVVSYVRFVKLATERGASFEEGMQVALQAVLVSPEFLFRAEPRGDDDGRRGDVRPLDDFELASRLSYFLWNSMPDEELFDAARAGKLHDDEHLEAQVRRMLADPKSAALIENFAGQWLGLRKLEELAPDTELFPEFNDELRRDMWRETELFFESIVREDRSILDLLDANYTFVNKRLADLYGLDVDFLKGEHDEFQRVSLEGTNRAGVLTHASILTLTSYPNRTSPVRRGEWILDNILGEAPPPPPPNVPAFEAAQEANPDLSLREQFQLHRSDPGCASCHNVMDAIGFGFENFDAIGRWRDKDGKFPIDSEGELPSGEQFSGPLELLRILKGRREEFARCVTEKLMTFALGRGIEYTDRCAVDAVLAAGRDDDYRFSSIVLAIVRSEPFRLRGGSERKGD